MSIEKDREQASVRQSWILLRFCRAVPSFVCFFNPPSFEFRINLFPVRTTKKRQKILSNLCAKTHLFCLFVVCSSNTDVKQFLSFYLFVGDIHPVLSSFLAEMLERHVIVPKKCAKTVH
jgi:hypothetical protein